MIRRVIDILIDVISAHKAINSVIFAPVQVAISTEIKYTAAIIELADISFNKVDINLHVKIYIIDKLNVNNSNLNDVMLDTAEIANDLNILLRAPIYNYENFVNLRNFSLTFLADKLKDNVAGVVIDLMITSHYNELDISNLPFNYENI